MSKSNTLLFFFLSLLLSYNASAISGISIIANQRLLKTTTTQKTIDDAIILLREACDCSVEVNDRSKEILLVLPLEELEETKAKTKQNYTWHSERKKDQIILTLHTASVQGISFGLYGLLQEQLWFSFHHPRQTIVPDLKFWPLTEEFVWEAKARFATKGFHINTKLPLELTEPLLNPDCPDGIAFVKEYIDWLVRNQQDYFEFSLLETPKVLDWVHYIQPAMEYAHARGIRVGLGLSLQNIYQKSFKLYQAVDITLESKKKRIAKKLAMLFEVNWDVINLDLTNNSLLPSSAKSRQQLAMYTSRLVSQEYGAKLMIAKLMTAKKQKNRPPVDWTNEQLALQNKAGAVIHSAMFYDLNDIKAPIYGKQNLLYLRKLLKEQKQTKETWYAAESAHGGTFEQSVPLLLLPYLEARLSDILYLDSLGIDGHLTVSAGWEWGAWLVDWSIARWSWQHHFNEHSPKPTTLRFLAEILPENMPMNAISELAKLQQEYIKNKNLIAYLAAASPLEELPPPFAKKSQPSLLYSYRWLARKATKEQILTLEKTVVDPLKSLVKKSDKWITNLDDVLGLNNAQIVILTELKAALKVTNLRAKHKIATLQYLCQTRWAKLHQHTDLDSEPNYLARAENIRKEALLLVKKQAVNYYYPPEFIAYKLQDGGRTAYNFGYLYPVAGLHFWKREEEQVKQNKFDVFFMNIWDIPKIIGMID